MTVSESFLKPFMGRLRPVLSRAKQLIVGASRYLVGPFGKPKPNTYLFVAINGAGLGHLTRCLAVARRLRRLEPHSDIAFFSTSVAVPIIVEAGFYAYHVPPAANLKEAGYNSADWNFIFAQQLGAVMSLHRPSRVIFDGTYPYPGLQLVMMKYRRPNWVWIRRGSSRQSEVLSQADRLMRKFQLVLEPGEVTEAERGPAQRKVPVPPILLLNGSDLLEAGEARSVLKLDASRPAVYVQLGAGVINDIADLQRKVIASLRSEVPGVQIVLGRSPIAVSDSETEADLTIVSYPNSRYFKAFDLLVLAAGYNSVAEAYTFQAPAIFFPNTSTVSDDQVSRASSVAALGNWHVLLGWDEAEFARLTREALDSGREESDRIPEDGANTAAVLIRDLEG